ncbi:hypothetical protein [Flavisolibacter ginsenosidimutans]|uniref:Uncharacterized protein n=1 Tax=Flavisolibacter ginsenosidimutans TaxID=661481 RepID=A0A5B8UPU3_9BACT|nr:hypothetical protein [Flavisolibacter ginsenosidimutans]QEC57965.1 hypothetical protein FSB75_19315 [Flavisolibacter ginsenosidimutans]
MKKSSPSRISTFLAVLLVCICLVVFVGCKKSALPPVTEYLRLAVDGVVVNATQGLHARSSVYLTIGGTWAGGSTSIEIHNFQNATGEWTVNPNYTTSPRMELFENGTGYYAGDGGTFGPQLGNGKVTISYIDDNYIKGTFEFVTAPEGATLIKKTVTGGEFSIKRSR